MHIGILSCGHMVEEVRAAHGSYPELYSRMLDGHGFRFSDWSVVDMDFPDSIDAADAWLLTGSRHGAYEPLPFIARLETFIRDAHAARKPMIGICFGHQIIAQALGGRVEKYHGGWALGRRRYGFSDGRAYALNAVHQDQVTTPPDGARTLASNDFCAHAALAYGGHILTLQPHPEIDADVLRTLVEARRAGGVFSNELSDQALSTADEPTDEPAAAQWLADFLISQKARAHV